MDDNEPDWIVVKAECSRPQLTGNMQSLFSSVLYSELAKSDIIFCQKTKSGLPKHSKVFCSLTIITWWAPVAAAKLRRLHRLYFGCSCAVALVVTFSSIICFIFLHSAIFGHISCSSSATSLLWHYTVKLVVSLCCCYHGETQQLMFMCQAAAVAQLWWLLRPPHSWVWFNSAIFSLVSWN